MARKFLTIFCMSILVALIYCCPSLNGLRRVFYYLNGHTEFLILSSAIIHRMIGQF
uniref:Uncharacterized protein n=1 Tax=Wuchereria bancrofti TaxID=6293 RepID=A0AAF5PTZ9_WUCBA